jgi:hypothetical protein
MDTNTALSEYIADLVAKAPTLSPEQRQILAVQLHT